MRHARHLRLIDDLVDDDGGACDGVAAAVGDLERDGSKAGADVHGLSGAGEDRGLKDRGIDTHNGDICADGDPAADLACDGR